MDGQTSGWGLIWQTERLTGCRVSGRQAGRQAGRHTGFFINISISSQASFKAVRNENVAG